VWRCERDPQEKDTRRHPRYKYSDRFTGNYSAFKHLLIGLAGVQAQNPSLSIGAQFKPVTAIAVMPAGVNVSLLGGVPLPAQCLAKQMVHQRGMWEEKKPQTSGDIS